MLYVFKKFNGMKMTITKFGDGIAYCVYSSGKEWLNIEVDLDDIVHIEDFEIIKSYL